MNQTAIAKKEGLVHNTPQEQLKQKLRAFKEDGLTANEKEELKRISKNFVAIFVRHIENRFGVSREQLASLEPHEIEELAEMCVEQGAWRAKLQAVFVGCMFIIFILPGFMTLVDMRDAGCSLPLRHYYFKMKKLLGSAYFPHEHLALK